MKYYNTFYAPSIEILGRNTEDHTLTRVIMKQGDGKLTKDEYEAVVGSETLHAYVKDGYIDFPNCSILGPMFNQKKEERIAREREIFNADPIEQDVPADLAELTALVGSQASDLADAKSFNADLVETNKKQADTLAEMMKRLSSLEAKGDAPAKPAAKPAAVAPVADEKAAPVATAPVTPAVAPAPVAAPVAAPVTKAPTVAPAPPPA